MVEKKSRTTICNEIRSPVNDIITKTRVLLDTKLNREQKEFVNSIKSNADFLLSFIDDTKEIEQGKKQPEGQDISSEMTKTQTVKKKMRPKGQRILVAEDRPVNQKITLKLLTKAGYAADVVSNGLEVIKALETSDYAIVLMDIEMPEMNGLEATRVIRDPQSKVRNHHIIIIALTGFDLEEDRDTCIKAGMNDYISKPINPKKLIDVLERHLSNIEQHPNP